jgi:hypothetical protein
LAQLVSDYEQVRACDSFLGTALFNYTGDGTTAILIDIERVTKANSGTDSAVCFSRPLVPRRPKSRLLCANPGDFA